MALEKSNDEHFFLFSWITQWKMVYLVTVRRKNVKKEGRRWEETSILHAVQLAQYIVLEFPEEFG